MADIQLWQVWKTRDGAHVTVIADRYKRFPANGWRWALSNDQIANESGVVGMNGMESGSDLMELVAPARVALSRAAVEGMDSTMGEL